MQRQHPERSDVVVASIFSGAIATVFGHPLDCIKVRRQVATTNISTAQTALAMYRSEGSAAFIRGCSAPLMNSLLMNTVIFVSFEEAKKELPGLSAGALAGLVASFIGTPFDRAKILMQLKIEHQVPLTQLLQQGGLRGLYTGHLMNCVRESLFGALYLGLYANIKEAYCKQHQVTVMPLPASVAAGGATGGLAWFAVYPVDVIKTRQQAATGPKSSLSVRTVAAQLWAAGGASAFYRGISASMLRAVLVTSSRLVSYEYFLQQLDSPRYG